MNSIQLADDVSSIVSEAQSRILGVGDEQYSDGDTQKFENAPIDQLLVGLEEELLDQINYAVMNVILIRRLRGRVLHAQERIENEIFSGSLTNDAGSSILAHAPL